MNERLCKMCEDILDNEAKTKEFKEMQTVDEMYEYFLKQIPDLSEKEFDSFLVDTLEDYEQIQNASKNIYDEDLENVAGGFNLGTKIASGALALSFFIPGVGATSKTLNNINTNANTFASKNVNNTDSATKINSEQSTDNSSFFSKHFDKEKLNKAKFVVSEKFKKTKNWIKRHKKAVITSVVLAVLAAPSIYSNIKHSTPKDIKNAIGETDEQISKYYAYDHTLSDIEYSPKKQEIESKVNEIIKEMNEHGCKNDYEKAVFLHDYIYNRCSFDMGRALDFFANTNRFRSEGCHDEYGCLLYNRAVCSGISEAYALLMSTAGVECKCIYGVSYGMDHAWNIVKINGQWYHVDITWDLLFKAAHGKYAWFMMTEKGMRKDHTPNMRES